MPSKIQFNNVESPLNSYSSAYIFEEISLPNSQKPTAINQKYSKHQRKIFLSTLLQLLAGFLIFFIATVTHASIVTGFDAESSNWFYDDGEDGLTYLDIQIRDISPIWIELNGSWQTGKTDEDFAISLWNLTGTYLTDLRLRWEKQDLNLTDAPIYTTDLNLQFLTRENNSAIIAEQNSGPNFHELWLDFAQDMGTSGILLIDFEWLNFNLPTGDFKLLIDFNSTQTNPVPIPSAFWFLFTGLLGLTTFKCNATLKK